MSDNKKLSDLTQIATLDNDDLVYVADVSANESKKITKTDIAADLNFISSTDATDLTDMGDTTLHYHESDRDNAEQSGGPLSVNPGPVTVQGTNVTETRVHIKGSEPNIFFEDTIAPGNYARITANGGGLNLISNSGAIGTERDVEFSSTSANVMAAFRRWTGSGIDHNYLSLGNLSETPEDNRISIFPMALGTTSPDPAWGTDGSIILNMTATTANNSIFFKRGGVWKYVSTQP